MSLLGGAISVEAILCSTQTLYRSGSIFFFLYRGLSFITYQLPLTSTHFWKWPLQSLCCMSEMSERSEEWQRTPQQQAALKAASLQSQDKPQQPCLPSTSHVEHSPSAIMSCALRREWQTLDKWARKLHSSLLFLSKTFAANALESAEPNPATLPSVLNLHWLPSKWQWISICQKWALPFQLPQCSQVTHMIQVRPTLRTA